MKISALFSRIRNGWAQRTSDAGMLTAEYAMTTVAACGAAGVLYKILTSDAFTSLISDLFRRALAALF